MSPIYLLVSVFLCSRQISACACPDAWTVFGSSCYSHGTHDVNFMEAESFCQQSGSHLVHINDATESAYVTSYLGDLDDNTHWIGLMEQDVEGVWKWYGTDATVTYFNWKPGQPDEGAGVNCGAIYNHNNYAWTDKNCTHEYKAFCEQPCLTHGPSVIG